MKLRGKMIVKKSQAGIPVARTQVSISGQESLEFIQDKAQTWKITESQACSRLCNELIDAEISRQALENK